MANEPINPHDTFFKQYLSHPPVAADFLRHQLPAPLVGLLDLTGLQLAKDSFVDEQLRSHFSDLIYHTTTTTQTPITLALLFEHKSYSDEWVDFQILRYLVNFWQQDLDQIHQEAAAAKAEAETTQTVASKRKLLRRTLTPILPLLVYHGQAEWKVSLRFARHLTGLEDLQSPLAQALAPYIPDFQPHFVNLTTMSDAEIRGEVMTRLFLLVLKHIFDQELGGHLDEILALAAAVMHQPTGMQMVVALLRYLGRSAIQLDKEEVIQKFVALLPKEGGVLMQTMAEEWIEEGKVIGRQEGRQETQRALILRVLRRRFSANPLLFQQIEQHLALIHDEDDLNQLVDVALEVFVLPDFMVKVQAFVPPAA